MTIIVFLVDTSASMNQRTYLGTSLLDVAKAAVETFMKIRARDPNSRWDRYMLLTYEDPPSNVKAGWKESHATFIKELKNLKALGLTSLGAAIKHTLDLLNVNRMTSGIDTYGQGRSPFYLEPAIIITITDGRKMTTVSGVQAELNLPMNNAVPGSELTKEPFRWDQRLFGIVLRMAAVPPAESQSPYIPTAEDSPVDLMCEVTGGRSYAISSQRMLNHCLESLVQKCQSGVVVNFEKIGNDPPPIDEKDEEKRSHTPTSQNLPWQNCRKLIYVPRSPMKGYSVGHWPIPESFWPDMNSASLPPRTAHPVVKFSCTSCEPMAIENLPFDKYEMEPSPLTQYILERRQPNVVWQVFVSNSAKYGDQPFGYIKASTNLAQVNLFVMPYNYPVLLPLIDDLYKVHKLKPTPKWRTQFEGYLKTMPVYYATPLKKALGRAGALVPDQMDNCLSYSVVSYLKKLKNQAKMEYDKMVSSVGQKCLQAESIKVNTMTKASFLERPDFKQLLQQYGGDMAKLKQELNTYSTFNLATEESIGPTQTYKNAFDIPRNNLLDQVIRMRTNFLRLKTAASHSHHTLLEQEHLHNMSMQEMGNYQEYLKKQPPPLREIETQPVRQHTFGNPFKVNKNLMIDETDEAMPGQSPSRKRAIDSPPASPRPNKRKPGPLPRDVPTRRLLSPNPDRMASPTFDLKDPSEASPNHFSFNHVSSDEEDGDFEAPTLQIDITEAAAPQPKTTNGTVPNEVKPGKNHVRANNPSNQKGKTQNQKQQMQHNLALKELVVKQVKRPGRDYAPIFNHLNSVQGTLDIRCAFIHLIKREALRFKKRLLAQMLDEFEQSMIAAEPGMKNNIASSIQKPISASAR